MINVQQEKDKKSKLQDKKSIMHIFSKIMHEPEILGNDREFPLETDDFVEPFHRIIFGAMQNLYNEGADSIDVIDIDGQISNFEVPYSIFNQNNGVEYLQTIKDTLPPTNFELHYERLKKYSFLRTCDSEGIDISEIFDVNNLDKTEEQRQQERFDSLSLDEMVRFIESKMIGLRDKFLFDEYNTSGMMGDNADEILEDMLTGSSYGAGMLSPYFTAATLGANMGKLFMVSANSGVGKTRWNLGNALLLTVPVYFDLEKQKWVKNKMATGDGALYTGTELEEEEVVAPLLCAIAGVDQTDVLEKKINEVEVERLRMAVKVLKKTPLYFERLMDFDLADIEHSISKHINKYGVRYVIHDYVHDSSKLMAYFDKISKGLQEHQRLLQVMTRLKDLAQKYNVFIMTSTQLNANHKMEGALDETAIAGAKSMVNKVDIGSIMSELTKEDEAILKGIKQSQPDLVTKDPNITINIFKARGTKWKMIRIWTYFDRGQLRMYDQFVTDYKGNLIEDLKPVEIMFENMEEADEKELPLVMQEEEYNEEEDNALNELEELEKEEKEEDWLF